jgi:hypothetical protein
MSHDDRQSDVARRLEALQRRLSWLTSVVAAMVLVLILSTSAVYGSLVNYFDGDAALFGGTTVGAAALGFGIGWFAGRRFPVR